jgi:serine protease AprX
MAIDIPTSLVEFILLGPADDRRQLQDSPILGDVWIEFAKEPNSHRDLLITPYMLQPAGTVAFVIDYRHDKLFGENPEHEGPNIAYLQGIVAAHLSFKELLRVVVPITNWWDEKRTDDGSAERGGRTDEHGHELLAYKDRAKLKSKIDFFISSAKAWRQKSRPQNSEERRQTKRRPDSGGKRTVELTSLDRYVLLTGLILWAMDRKQGSGRARPKVEDKIDRILDDKELADGIADAITGAIEQIIADNETINTALATDPPKIEGGDKDQPLVWQISLNRAANPALSNSVPAVKADAAKFLFKVDTSSIAWAILDSGIDGKHPAFRKEKGPAIRIKKSFDFRNFRRIISLSNAKPEVRKDNVAEILQHEGLKIRPSGDDENAKKKAEKEVDGYLAQLAGDAGRGSAAIHWNLVEKLVEIDPNTDPYSNHGTHVAGILGASKKGACSGMPNQGEELVGAKARRFADIQDGMCPEINLFDFRVIAPNMEETEFAIIGALQYIRYLNDRDNFYTIHGANLSLSIPHDVRNFACGSTPICKECERLADSGVVVVAAAGNHGYKSFETKEGAYESYAAFSITDPGNADGIITVGATHRNWPHTYGVSFFSSRGPTGDGRLKPDLVAPGERIRAPIPGGNAEEGGLWGDLDGTSMAAPHVSGAAAMLLARYSELIGQPSRVKRILCETATDLGRERSFQGHGMLDVLRAFQSI